MRVIVFEEVCQRMPGIALKKYLVTEVSDSGDTG